MDLLSKEIDVHQKVKLTKKNPNMVEKGFNR